MFYETKQSNHHKFKMAVRTVMLMLVLLFLLLPGSAASFTQDKDKSTNGFIKQKGLKILHQNVRVHSSGLNSLSPYLNLDPSFLTQDGGAEFVFAEDSTKRRGWGERMFSSIGGSYMTGLTVGGVWGFIEGARSPDGATFKLRLNSVLNGCTRRGPFLANSLGVVALMYGCTNTAIEKLRGVEDEYNSIAAAVSTGVLFKSTAGPRAVAIAGGLGGGLALLYYTGNKLWNSRGQTWSTSQPNWA